mmetsp:Transcript_15556/g.24181  ORF Transcript_15556/g.24181 Transcript_15556/m.24181 type:complete len:219 (+) Transcript_15556:901-1557(+)
MLSKSRNTKMHITLDKALCRLQLIHHQLHQCRFSSSIRSHEGYTGIEIYSKIHILVQLFAAGVCKAHILNLQYGHRQLTRIREVPIILRRGFRLWRQTCFQLLLQKLLARLRLFHHFSCTVTETCDKILDFGNILLLCLIRPHLHHVLITTSVHICIVIATVVTQFLVGRIQPDNVRADIVHKILRVTNEEENAVPRLEVILQPQHCLHIQVIGRFVQ